MRTIIIALILTITTTVQAQDSACLQYRMKVDSVQMENRELKKKLFIANYKVEKVRYYLNICLKNNSQTKFLKGWIKRAIE